MPLRLVINILFLFSFLWAHTQDYEIVDTYDEHFHTEKFRPFITVRNLLLAEDYLLGTEVGVASPARNFTFFASFDFRPFRKKVLNYQGNNLFYQNAEQRFFIGAGAEYLKYMEEKNYGVFAQLNGSYTWAYYGGSEVIPPKGFVLNPKAGVFWHFVPSWFLKIGYAYQETKHQEVGKHRVYLAITGIIQ